MSRNGRILVAMSGGVDSTVAALNLHESGYEVVGVTMKTWDYSSSGTSQKETGCCSLDSINDARNVAVRWKFHHIILDLREEFEEHIIGNFVSEYLRGRTPNPCVLCNTYIKWEALLKRADNLDCEFIATGHYAGLKKQNNRFYITKGIDEHKDQSYVLWGIEQRELARTIFPLGGFTKDEIKKTAISHGLEEIANKSESYEICFIPDNNYRRFLRHKAGNEINNLDNGKFISTDGKILGYHRGYPFYTIGQRKGLGIAADAPLYVVEICPENNTIVLGYEHELLQSAMRVTDLKMMKYESLEKEKEATIKIRYKDPGRNCLIIPEKDRNVYVHLKTPAHAITPGQSAVFYEGIDIIGGGIIMKAFDDKIPAEQSQSITITHEN